MDDDDVTLDNVDCVLSLFGDSICDEANNNSICGALVFRDGDCVILFVRHGGGTWIPYSSSPFSLSLLSLLYPFRLCFFVFFCLW